MTGKSNQVVIGRKCRYNLILQNKKITPVLSIIVFYFDFLQICTFLYANISASNNCMKLRVSSFSSTIWNKNFKPDFNSVRPPELEIANFFILAIFCKIKNFCIFFFNLKINIFSIKYQKFTRKYLIKKKL